ncbi:MAG: ABC-F family ATP-binding cassette domain-containing protein [Muribaculaceae bacterium]|nr:ABC-F family ATP-binding cassette domain-containing protein [Muribaculaceae bacterium]
MANILSVENLTKSYGDRMLFADITFGVDEGDKIGVVARNGTGKTTMLRIIAGDESADSGSVVCRNGLRIGYLPQEPHFAPGATVRSAAMEALPQTSRLDDPEAIMRLLASLGLDEESKPVEKLSGGQRKKLAIARAVIADPELLILDEPTNHLDIATIEWLENYLKRSRVAILMVTHDRYFLDRVCNKIMELDRTHAYMVDGNYDMYLRRRAERIEAMGAELAKVKNTLRREQDWMSRQPQARAGKAKFRIDNFYELKARSRVNLNEQNVRLDAASSRIGSKIFEAEGVCKRFGDKVILDDFSYTFARGEKIGIVGVNGVGKSTFIKMLQGLEPFDSGRWDIGETVRFGYYSQDGIAFDERKKVIDAVTEIAEDIFLGEGVRIAPMQYLQRFLFAPADQQKYIHTLSGGERCRLHLATVLMRQPNFLILDEPTNDLDIITLGILEEYLADFKGCVMVVSHDRFFLDNIADHLFVMEGNGVIKDFPGSYSDYRAFVQTLEKEKTAAKTPAADNRPRRERPDNKMTFKERREFEALGGEIEALSEEKTALEDFFSAAVSPDPQEFADKSRRYEEVKNLLDEKELRWLELSEKS